MCGIFGIGFMKGSKVKDTSQAVHLVEALGQSTESYGSKCAGIAIANPSKITFAKTPENMMSFLKKTTIKNMLRDNIKLGTPEKEESTYALIGHCRYPTKGPKENNVNNHPIKVENIIGVHAGHVNSDDRLFLENKDNFKRIGGVDSEIIFQLINYYRKDPMGDSMVNSIKRAAPVLEGTFSCAILSTLDKYKVYLIKSGPSLEVVFYNKLGLIMFATSYAGIIEPVMRDIFKKEELENKKIALDMGNGLALNLNKNTYSRFAFEKNEPTKYLR